MFIHNALFSTGVGGVMVWRFACHAEDPISIPVGEDLVFLLGFFLSQPGLALSGRVDIAVS